MSASDTSDQPGWNLAQLASIDLAVSAVSPQYSIRIPRFTETVTVPIMNRNRQPVNGVGTSSAPIETARA